MSSFCKAVQKWERAQHALEAASIRAAEVNRLADCAEHAARKGEDAPALLVGCLVHMQTSHPIAQAQKPA